MLACKIYRFCCSSPAIKNRFVFSFFPTTHTHTKPSRPWGDIHWFSIPSHSGEWHIFLQNDSPTFYHCSIHFSAFSWSSVGVCLCLALTEINTSWSDLFTEFKLELNFTSNCRNVGKQVYFSEMSKNSFNATWWWFYWCSIAFAYFCCWFWR